MREIQDLKPKTKAFALRIICLYSVLAKTDAVTQMLGKQIEFFMQSGSNQCNLLSHMRQKLVAQAKERNGYFDMLSNTVSGVFCHYLLSFWHLTFPINPRKRNLYKPPFVAYAMSKT